MSTYTDLHNKLKETINVDYRSRNTNQEVHLKNEKNEYWGSFTGKMDVENATISKAQLSDITLNGDILVNGRFIGSGLSVDVNKIMDTISDLSTQLYQDDDETHDYGDIVQHNKHLSELDDKAVALDKKIDNLKLSSAGDLSSVSADIISQVSAVSADIISQVSAVSTSLSSQDSELSNAIDEEVHARQKDDNKIIMLLNNESNTRLAVDDEISSLALSVDSESKDRDLQLKNALDEYAKGNAQQFKNLEERMLSTIAHDKHYAILDNEEMFKSYPYELQDFAVNVLKTSVKDGIVLDDTNIPVASIIHGRMTAAEESTFIVTFYDVFQNPKLLQAVWPGSQFELIDGVARPTHKNDYTISYSTAGNEIRLIANSKPYLELHHALDNRLIGKIKNFLSSSDDDNIISGSLYVDAGKDSELSVFNKFTDRIFNSTTSSLVVDETEEIQFKHDEKLFVFRKGVYDKYYCPIKDTDDQSKVFGRIYEGDVTEENSQLKSVKVTIDGQEVLLSSPTFCTDYRVELSSYMLCCNAESHVFEKCEKHAHYQYGYWDNGEHPECRGHVILTAENRFLMPLDFQEISVTIENTELKSLAGRTFVLGQVDSELFPLNPLWKYTIFEPEHDLNVDLLFNGYVVQLTGTIESQPCNSKWDVRLEDVSIANSDAYSKSVNKSSFVDWNSYPEVVPGCIASYDVNYQIPSRQEDFDNIICQVSSDGLSSIDFIAPLKDDGSDISREFIVAVNISSMLPTIRLNVNGNSQYDPVEVKFNGEDKLEISSNTTMLLQFNEISNHSFIVTDLEHNFEHDKINDIYRDLGIKAQQISVLSDDVVDIYKQIKGGLVYKDMLSIDIPSSERDPAYSLSDFIDLFFNNYYIKAERRHREKILSMPLRSGFYYISQAADKTKKYAFEDVEIANGDLIVIKENTLLSNITKDNVNIIDVFDADAVHMSDLSAVSSAICLSVSEISNAVSLSVESMSSFIREDISAKIADLSVKHQDEARFLSGAISSKVFISSYIPEDQMNGSSDLSIIKIRKDDYDALAISGHSPLCANTLYVVDSDYLDAYGQVLSNLAMGENDHMLGIAATDTYVDAEDKKLSNEITGLSSQLNSASSYILNDVIQPISGAVALSVEAMSALVSSISADLSANISSLSADLSNEISILDYHYARTFEKDVHVDMPGKNGISVDILKMTDEDGLGNKYTLHLSAGTLVLISATF